MPKIQKHKVNNFPVIVQKDEDGFYFVECPIFDGCFTQGKTVEKALENIKEAIELCLEEKENRALVKSDLAGYLSLHLVTV